MRRLALGRTIGLLIAVGGIGVSCWLARDAVRWNADFHGWLEARPLEVDVDLSQPGGHTTTYRQTCRVAHGAALFLECDLKAKTEEAARELLAGLSGSIVILDRQGEVVERARLSDAPPFWDEQVMLAHLSPSLSLGEYVATIEVIQGASALAGMEQVVYAKYQLCGMEMMPAVIMGAFSFVTGAVGLVAVACVAPGLWREGLWRQLPPTDVAGVADSEPPRDI